MRFLIASVALLLATGSALASNGYSAPQPGERLIFDVFRQGDTRFGTHEVVFDRDGDEVVAEISIRLRAGVGPITVFRYEHDSVERWRDGRLISLTGTTLKDGDTFEVDARSSGDAINVQGRDPEGEPVSLALPASILSSSHWHGYPEDMAQMLNTEHGTVMETVISHLGQTEIEGDGGMITVDHYRLESSLTVDLYYDQNGRWAGCEFDARGQSVRYVRRESPV